MSRNPDPGFDPRIADWLEADPDHAPPDVLRTVESALPSIPQRRVLRLPWRKLPVNRIALLGATAAIVAVVGFGGLLLASRSPDSSVGSGPTPLPASTTTPTPSPTPSPIARVDYSDVPGRLLIQHLGNALDGSELDTVNGHYDRRRFYLMNPDGSNLTEFLPGQPASGKNHADISPDQTKVTFQDSPATGGARIYEANLDGSGFRLISTPCDCSEEQPAYSPDGAKIAFTRMTPDGSSMIAVRDLASGKVTTFPETKASWPSGTAGDSAEHPSWSPDGKVVVFALIHRDADGKLMSSKLLKLDVATHVVTDIGVPEALGAGEPRYRPDGSVILFASRSAETSLGESQGNIYTVHPDGTALTQLTDTGATGASWTPDGRYIIYMSNWIYLMEPDGSNKARWSISGPDLSKTETGYGYTTYWIPAAP